MGKPLCNLSKVIVRYSRNKFFFKKVVEGLHVEFETGEEGKSEDD